MEGSRQFERQQQYVEKVDVRLLPSQKRLVEASARRVGLSASSWVRMIILDKLDGGLPDE